MASPEPSAISAEEADISTLFSTVLGIDNPTNKNDSHSKPAIVQAVAKSILKIPSRNSDKCLLREADSDQYHKAQEEKRAKEREERAEAKKQRHAGYLQREKARQDAMAARKAAEHEARGQVGYAVERGVTKIGRNYM